MNSESWSLHPQLVRDTIELGDLALSRVLIIKDANYPWLLLVPRRPDIVELIDLDEVEQAQLMVEINRAARALKDGHGMRQAEYRSSGQRGAAASRAHHRAPQDRQGLAEAGMGAGARARPRFHRSRSLHGRDAQEALGVVTMQKPVTALGPWPALGYIDSVIERAAEWRTDPDFLSARAAEASCGFYLVGGEMVVLKAAGDLHDPVFSGGEIASLATGPERIFLGLPKGAARFGLPVAAETIETLKADARFVVTDLRSIAVQGLVAPDHLPPLAEAKALAALACAGTASAPIADTRPISSMAAGGAIARNATISISRAPIRW